MLPNAQKLIASAEIMKPPTSPLISPHHPARKLKSAIKPIAHTRRTFLKSSAGVGLAVVFGLPTEDAQAADEPSGSWWPASVVFTLKVEYKADELVDYCWDKNTIPPAGSAPVKVKDQFADKAALLLYLGLNAGQKMPHTFTQTVTWDEWLSDPLGYGDTPDRFRKLSYVYGSNLALNVVFDPFRLAAPAAKYGVHGWTEGYFPKDTWTLTGITLGINSPHILGSPGNPTRYYSSGNTTEGTNDKAMATFWESGASLKADCKSVTASGNWNGTNNTGVGGLEVSHSTWVGGWFLLALKDNHTFMGVIAPNTKAGVLPVHLQATQTPPAGTAAEDFPAAFNPCVTRTDWHDERKPKSKAGRYFGAGANPMTEPYDCTEDPATWLIHVKRGGGVSNLQE